MKNIGLFSVKRFFIPFYCFPLFLSQFGIGQQNFEQDMIETSSGNLELTFIGHGTLMFKYNNLVILAQVFKEL